MINRNFSADGSDETYSLICEAREGSQEAFSDLLFKYAPLIESLVAKYKLADMSSTDVEDMRQEAKIIFCKAILNFDINAKEVEFGLYAKICMQNGLISFIRAYSRREKPLSLYDELITAEKTFENVDFLQNLVNKENLAELVRVITGNLSKFENRVWWMYVSGMSVSDIAEAIGGETSAKSVSNAVFRIRKKLKNFLSDRCNF